MERDVVTPDALSVAPELLGRPLARPWRRLAAMAVDLVAVGLLAGLPAMILGVVGAAVCFRSAWRPGEARSRTRRVMLFVLGGLLLMFAVAGTFFAPDGRSVVQIGAGDHRVDVAPGAAVGFLVQTLALQTAKTDAERRAAARALVAGVIAAEPDRESARALLSGLAAELSSPDAKAALEAAVSAELPERPAASPSPEHSALADARRDLRAAEQRVSELQEKVAVLERPRGMLGALRGFADDLGLGFGWGIVYFTALTAWWKGRTVGKRLLGCRVVRLDGRPLSWWHSFNRAGGYAASLATGLLGFAELLWEPNRQALHDRIYRTVVLRDVPKA